MTRKSIFFSLLLLLASSGAIASPSAPYRSPVDVALDPKGEWLVSANQTSGTLSLIDLAEGRVLDELTLGNRLSYVVVCPDGETALVS
ncbi:MAG: YncE family protein, partial [Blastopirellula sp. JB062]